MSFGPDGSLCVAVQDNDNGQVLDPLLPRREGPGDQLLQVDHEEMQDFAVGNRMLWDRHSPDENKSTY